MRMAVLYAIVLIACHSPVPPPVDTSQHAQPTHAAGGTIQGVVALGEDRSGPTAIAGASIVVASVQLHERRTATTDERGFYQIADLRPADDYVVMFSFGRLTAERVGVTVTDGAHVSVSQMFTRPAGPSRVPNCSDPDSDGFCFP